MSYLRPIAVRVGPLPTGPALEVTMSDGQSVLVELDIAHASAIADRLRECVDGRVCARPPSRRVLQITLGPSDAELAETEPPSAITMAVVPDLERDRVQQGPL